MAVASPITINTSSPPSLRITSITPPSLERSVRKLSFSSPQLPSPSTFVKSRTTGLKSGSRVQQVPNGVEVGFASAGILWREKRFEGEEDDYAEKSAVLSGKDGESVAEAVGDILNDSTGKLVKPKQQSKEAQLKDVASKNSALTRPENQETTAGKRTIAADCARANVYDVPVEDTSCNIPGFGKPGLGLSEYAFAESNGHSKIPLNRPLPEQPKKSRKKVKKPAAGDGMPKKPRKRTAKSEAIILNSDEPGAADGSMRFPARTSEKKRENVESVSKDAKPKRPATRKPAAKKRPLERAEMSNDFANGTEKDISDIQEPNGFPEQSIYFVKPPVSAAGHAHSAPVRSPNAHPKNVKESNAAVTGVEDLQPPEIASRRRLDWTPPKDTGAGLHCSRPTTAGSEMSNSSHIPRLQLTDVLAKFNYVYVGDGHTDLPQRTVDGEAATKRRRIELSDTATLPAGARKPAETVAVKQPKRAKEPKKKAQTITALATAAFQPPKEIETDQATVSAFFTSRDESAVATETQCENRLDQEARTAKPKKPRKPRAKSKAASDNAELLSATSEPKKATGAKKKKVVKMKDADPRLRLYSPTRAKAQISEQKFHFCTSSQLTPAESPEYTRQVQVAVRASGDFDSGKDSRLDFASQAPASSAAPLSPQEKSCARVPTAPHGTCLSVEQAARELWCVGARDFTGSVFSLEECDGPMAEDEDNDARCEVTEEDKAMPSMNRTLELENGPEHSIASTDTSPLGPERQVDELGSGLEQPELSNYGHGNSQVAISPPPLNEDEDDRWMILGSDSSTPRVHQPQPGLPAVALSNENTTSAVSPRSSTVIKFASPQMFRRALYPLDSNASLGSTTVPDKIGTSNQIRAISSTAPDQSRDVKRPRGRPRKDAITAMGPVASPKKRGRPAKARDAASSPPRSKVQKPKPSASQPALQSRWLNIDEISDSDAPTTPSPPRRRGSSSPPTIRPLLLSPSGSQVTKDKAPVEATAPTVKPDGPQWPSMKASLYPRITGIVKSAPRGSDAGKLSWWEKILLYDPIVVEDLTAWLHEQGVRVDVRKQKAKTNGKKRKEGAAQGDNMVELEWEVHEEPLQPWMVQKWCEEKSICCFMRHGGWRGRRGT